MRLVSVETSNDEQRASGKQRKCLERFYRLLKLTEVTLFLFRGEPLMNWQTSTPRIIASLLNISTVRRSQACAMWIDLKAASFGSGHTLAHVGCETLPIAIFAATTRL